MIRRAVLGFLGAAFLVCGWPALADSPLSEPHIAPVDHVAPQPAENDRAILHRLLEAARAEQQPGTDAGAPPAAVTQDEILERNHLRSELVGALERHLDVLERLPDARQRLAEQEARTRDWTAFPFPPPYSVLLLDQLRNDSDTARAQADAAATRETLADQQLNEDTRRLKDAEIAVRQSEERIAQAKTPNEADYQRWRRDLARLRARAAAAAIGEGQADKILTAVGAAEQRSLANLYEKQLAVARKTVQFTQSELDGLLATLGQQRAALEKRSAQLKESGLQSRQTLSQAQRQLTIAKAEPLRIDETAADRTARLGLLERVVALRRLQADNDELAYDMTRRTIEVGDWERTGWQYRWLLINSSDRQKLRDALSNMDRLIERLEGWYRFIQGETLRAQRKGDDAGFAAPGTPSPEEAAVAAEYLAAQRTRAEIMRGAEQSVGNLLRTLGLWRQDVQWRDAERLPPTVVSDWWSATGHALTAIWTFELFAAEDNLEIDGQRVTAVRSVTVGKSLGVILLVLFGSLIGAQGIRIAKNLAVTHLRVHRNHADIIARWSHIVLLSMLVIIGLYLTNIPLTVFAFLGGALAIGVGFGTQVMLKNMISGIMLLVERPLRIGDIVEVGSVVGTVTNISIRSSTVRTSDGIEILVPNSTFIENNVTNWTYSNPRVRRMVTVGADYAAPPEKVAAVLRGVADRHPSVLKDPAPQVLLSEFGGDAAHFTLRYWIDYGAGADGSMIASDLRFMIAKALAEAGVAIPLPQRVIHLKTTAENSMPATEER